MSSYAFSPQKVLRTSWCRMRPCRALPVALVVAGIIVAPGHADNPALGGYTQPAPQPVQEKHATDVANRVLRREGSHQTVSTPSLRTGVVLPSRPDVRKKPRTKPKTVPRSHPTPTRRLAGAGLDPARRAGVSGPVDQRVATTALWAIVALVLVAGAATVELIRRRV